MTTALVPLDYHGNQIAVNRDGMVSLTDMWRAAGSPAEKRPPDWIPLPQTQDLLEVCGLNTGLSGILKTTRGRTGGTWAIPNLAVAYAKYLSPEFHAWANQAILERLEEERDPELAYTRGRQRAVDAWKREGKSDEWIAARLKGIEARNTFTAALKSHGVSGDGYRICTNAIYQPLLGGTAADVRARRHLPAKANVRESLGRTELAAVMLTEILAEEKIDKENRRGTPACAGACADSAGHVAEAVRRART